MKTAALVWGIFLVFLICPGRSWAQDAKSGKFPPEPQGFVVKGNAKAGQGLYQANCAICHGSRGDGTGIAGRVLKPRPTDFTDSVLMKKRTDWQLFQVIQNGGAPFGLSSRMASYKSFFDSRQIEDLIAYIRTLAK